MSTDSIAGVTTLHCATSQALTLESPTSARSVSSTFQLAHRTDPACTHTGSYGQHVRNTSPTINPHDRPHPQIHPSKRICIPPPPSPQSPSACSPLSLPNSSLPDPAAFLPLRRLLNNLVPPPRLYSQSLTASQETSRSRCQSRATRHPSKTSRIVPSFFSLFRPRHPLRTLQLRRGRSNSHGRRPSTGSEEEEERRRSRESEESGREEEFENRDGIGGRRD